MPCPIEALPVAAIRSRTGTFGSRVFANRTVSRWRAETVIPIPISARGAVSSLIAARAPMYVTVTTVPSGVSWSWRSTTPFAETNEMYCAKYSRLATTSMSSPTYQTRRLM